MLGRFLDNFIYRLQWTLGQGYRTILRNGALSVRSRVHRICKSPLAGGVITHRRQAMLFHPRFVRYRAGARAVSGRVVVPQRVTSSTSELKPAQRRALMALESEPGASLTRGEYERLTGAGRSQAAYDLSELVSAGLFVRVGGGRSTRYVLAHEPALAAALDSRPHSPRARRVLRHRSAWPTASEFKTAAAAISTSLPAATAASPTGRTSSVSSA